MTNWWADAANTKLAVVLGGNPAENHPGVMQWLNKAIDDGGEVMVIDPRKTRTAVWAQGRGGMHVALRPGTDSALICGVMNYAITNDSPSNHLIDYIYMHNFTDASFMLDGNPLGTASAVNYARMADSGAPYAGATTAFVKFYNGLSSDGGVLGSAKTPATGTPWTLDYDECKTYANQTGTVWDYLKQRVSHYTPSVVADICGMTVGEFNAIAAKWTSHRGDNNSPAAIFYAMGGTQHSTAGQQLHNKCMLQCMLGNMSKNGGGVNALRGIHNVQGSTDMGVLKDSLPGYYTSTPADGQTYVAFMNGQFGTTAGATFQMDGYRNMVWWWFRQGANPIAAQVGTYNRTTPTTCTNNNHDLMPRSNGYSHVAMFQHMKNGDTKALFVLGQNPAVTEPNLSEIRLGMEAVDTLVVSDLYYSETAGVSRKTGGVTYLLPSCAHPEESGTVTSSARMLMWRYMASGPKGNSQTDLEILLRLAKSLDGAGAFAHIPGGSYATLYGNPEQYDWTPSGDASGVPAAWGDVVGTNTNGQPKYKGEEVAEAVLKQFAGPMPTPSGAASAITGVVGDQGKYGTHWLYNGAYDRVQDGVSYRYGTNLAASAAPGTTLVVSHNVTAGKHLLAAGAKLIVGQYGTHGARSAANASSAWPDGGTESYGYDSTASLTGGGNEEIVTVASVSGTGPWTITLNSPGITKEHALGEPVTARGYWSYHASDGIIAKSRATYDPGLNSLFPRFGWAWLLNRRIFYNNNPCTIATQPGSSPGGRTGTQYVPGYVTHCEDACPNRPTAHGGTGACKAPGDAYDLFVKADKRATLFVPHNDDAPPLPDYTPFYRSYNKLAEVDYPAASADWSVTNTGPYTANARARYPKHWEPWETPRQDLRAKYGRQGVKPTMMGGSDSGITAYPGDLALGSSTTYPLVLTTGRICWHFQGGPLSRNNPWLCELDSEAYVILNAFDAGANGIVDGDTVAIQTHRGTVQMKARVGVGPQSTQNVKQGVVWMPWHWGNQGLSTGASANDVCIDALDSNSLIPESKSCLCRVYKV